MGCCGGCGAPSPRPGLFPQGQRDAETLGGTAGPALPRWVTTNPPSFWSQCDSEGQVSPQPRSAGQEPGALGSRRGFTGGQVSRERVSLGDFGK